MANAGLLPVKATVSQLSEISHRFEAFMAQQVDELSVLQEKLATREGERARQREQWEALRRRQEQTDRLLREQSSRLEQAEAELAGVRAQLAAERERWAREPRTRERELQELVEALRRERVNLERELGALRLKVARQTDLVAELERVRNELVNAGQALAAAHTEMSHQREVAAAENRQAEHDFRVRLEAQGQQAASLEQDRTRLRQELETAQVQVARQAELVAELERVRNELANAGQELAILSAVRQELAQCQEQLEQYRHELSQHRDSAADESELTRQQREQLEQARREHEELERELELLLTRSAEMADTLAQERREATEQRLAWEAEIHALRQALESQAGSSRGTGPMTVGAVRRMGSSPSPAPRTGNRSVPNSAVAADPVLDSVVAQFTTLKSSSAARRANSAERKAV